MSFRRSFLLPLLLLSLSAVAAPTRYLVMGKNALGDVGLDVQAEMIRLLPPDVEVFYFYASFEQKEVEQFFAKLPSGRQAPKIRLFPISTGVVWTRDATPELVQTRDGRWKLVSFAEPVQTRSKSFSEEVGPIIARELGVPLEHSTLIMPGGNILVDDERQLFATDLVVEKNPGWKLPDIVAELKRALEVDRVSLLPRLPGEFTGHIDTFVFYEGGKKVMVASSTQPEQNATLDRVSRVFEKAGFRIDRVPINPSFGEFTTQSYTNSQVVNDRVFIPAYGHLRNDDAAVNAFSKLGLFVLPLNCQLLSQSGGEIHCITREYPSCQEAYSWPVR